MSWRLVHGSVIGTSHVEAGALCQDVSLAGVVRSRIDEEVLLAIASDGAGSAALSHIGASTACAVAYEELKQFVWRSTAAIDFAALDPARILAEVHIAIVGRAEIAGATCRDLACTLLVAAIAQTSSFYLQIGDGAIVTTSGGDMRVVFWPETGEYANMTYFATDENANDHLNSAVAEGGSEVAVLTDGLQRLALRYDERRPHEPFFHPLFRTLREWQGSQGELTSALVSWMNSDAVNIRTDDDKTLILATRGIGIAQGSNDGEAL